MVQGVVRMGLNIPPTPYLLFGQPGIPRKKTHSLPPFCLLRRKIFTERGDMMAGMGRLESGLAMALSRLIGEMKNAEEVPERLISLRSPSDEPA